MGGSPAADILVGRDAELAVLDWLAARAAAGAGGVVLLCGEPGAGKTRLAREAAGRARGAVVSWGRAGNAKVRLRCGRGCRS